MDKKPIIIIGVLCVISLGLGYLSGLKDKESPSTGDNKVQTTEKKEPDFLKKGLVAYYPFNGNAKDESGNGNDGEALNRVSLTTDRNGIDGKAYYFNHVWSRIRIPDSASWKVSPITISAWVNAKSIGERSPCFISSANPADGIGFSIGVSSEGKLYYWVGVDEVRRVNGVRTFTNEDMELDKWHHLLMTYGQNTATLYVNGNPVHSLKAGNGILYKNNRGSVTKLLIGRHNDERNRGAQWSGSIDDVRIYNRALSEAEVKELYEFEKPKTQQASTATWTSDPSDPQNVIVEKAIRESLNKPTGELTKADLESLTNLNLNDNPRITDEGLKEVAKLQQLTSLVLFNCHLITDASLNDLAKLKSLTYLNCNETKITATGIAELQKALPNCKIIDD